MSDSGKSLFQMYTKGDGRTILAHRLKCIFDVLNTQGDVALHNDAVVEMRRIIEGRERLFLSKFADLILYERIPKRKRFLFRWATMIMEIGHKRNG